MINARLILPLSKLAGEFLFTISRSDENTELSTGIIPKIRAGKLKISTIKRIAKKFPLSRFNP